MNLRRDEPFADAHIAWDAPQDRVPDSYTVVIINHLLDDDITEVSGITELFYEEPIHVDVTDKSYKVKAVYEECESEFALNTNGEDFIRVTSLDVPESMFSAALYPNPTTGQLTVEMEGLTSVVVYDLVGQCLMESMAKEGSAQLDLNGLKNGVYLVKASTATGSVIEKVVKM